MGERPQQHTVSYEYAGRIFISTLAYPLENAKVLIQIGYEPIRPYPSTTIFGSPVLCLPNIFKYIKFIYKVDGKEGCYRGFFPWLASNLLYKYTLEKTKEAFPKVGNEEKNEDDLTEKERMDVFVCVLYRGIVCRTVAVIVTQPLHVLTIRTIAQFVGKETKYIGIFTGLWTILKEEGIHGLFSGLVPRLLGDLFVFTFATTGIYVIRNYIVKDNEARKYSDTVMQYIASAAFYSFTVVGTCMAVTGSGLAAGSPPNMPHYSGWLSCWSHLQSIQQLKRGSSVLWRYYTPQRGLDHLPSDRID